MSFVKYNPCLYTVLITPLICYPIIYFTKCNGLFITIIPLTTTSIYIIINLILIILENMILFYLIQLEYIMEYIVIYTILICIIFFLLMVLW